MVQHLTVEEIKKKARETYEVGKLTAQHPDINRRICVYSQPDGYFCAIGCALTEDVLSKIRNTQTIAHAYNASLINIDKFEEARCIQQLHDDWCNAAQQGSPSEDEDRLRFLQSIDHPASVEL